MRIGVTYGVEDLESRDISGATAVVIDCFRASTSIVAALAAGANAVYPFVAVDDAVEAAAAMGGAVLGGERGGARIEGFDLGNSPEEYTAEAVAGRNVVMTTTNGTKVLAAAAKAEAVYVGCFVNAGATVRELLSRGGEVVLTAAGTEGYFSIEDALCAGMMIERLCEANEADLEDSSLFARLAYKATGGDVGTYARRGRGASNIRALALDADMDYCLAIDSAPIVAKVLTNPLRVVKA